MVWEDLKYDFALELTIVRRYVLLVAAGDVSACHSCNRDKAYQLSRNARNCSFEPASGEVEQKRTKNCVRVEGLLTLGALEG